MTEALLRPPDPPVDDHQDEEQHKDKHHAADEGDEPGLRGELLHVHVSARAHVDGGHQTVGVHGEHQGRGEGAVTLASEGGRPDDIGLVEAQVTCTQLTLDLSIRWDLSTKYFSAFNPRVEYVELSKWKE